MPKTFRINVSLSEAEMAEVQRIQDDLERMAPGISVSQPDAVRHLMLRDRRHEARLHHLNIDALWADVAEALRSRGWEPDRIVATLEALQEAHEAARELHLPKLEVRDIP